MDDVDDEIDIQRIERRLRQGDGGAARDPFQGRGVVFDLPGDLQGGGAPIMRNRGPGGSWPGAAAFAPPFNRGPSGSAAGVFGSGTSGAGSVTTMGSVAVFGRANRRTLEEVTQDEVIVRKGDRGAQGSKVFVANRLAATQALSVKFLGSVHLLSKNAAGENVQKAKNIQDQFVSNLDVMSKVVERMKQYDMLLPLQIPAEYYNVVGVEDRWDMSNPNRSIIDLSSHWGKLSSEHVYLWQQDWNGYCEDVDHVSNIWLKDFISNCLDPELKKQVDEKYRLLDDYQRGGISYFKIAAERIFQMSSMAEESLKSFMKEFGEKGLAKVPHENVRTIATQMDGVAERLADANKLRSESIVQYITGLTICSVAPFKAVFMNRLTEFTYLDATGDITLSSMTGAEILNKIKEVSTAAKSIYDHLHLGNKWNVPGKHGHHANIVNKCDNCGALDHYATKCPKPRDEARCKKAREDRQAKKDLEGGGRGGRGGRGKRGGRGGRGDREGDRAPWNDDNAKKGTNGVMNIEGTWKMNCSKCGWNETHTSKYHDEQARNAASFKIPAHHPYWQLSGKSYQAAGVAAVVSGIPGASAASTVTGGSSMLGSLTSVIDRAITSTESSEMSSFLAEMRRALEN